MATEVSVHGVTKTNKEEKGAQYADDFWLMLENDQDNLNEVINELEQFKHFSGLKVNYHKSVVLRIGPIALSTQELSTKYGLKWSSGPIKILGILIQNDLDNIAEINYSPLLQKTKEIITMWRKRTLTPIGKVQVVNSLISSLFVCKFMGLPSPSLIAQFTWNSPVSKVRYNKIIQDFQNGSLKLVDLKSKDQAMKTAWTSRATR